LPKYSTGKESAMRVVGLDVSRTVAEIAYLEDGRIRAGGRVELQRAALQAFAMRLRPTDEVVLEATGNTQAIVAALKAQVAQVVVANPLQVRLIAEAKVKTDKIDAAVLAQLYASGFLPEVWIPDEDTQALRRQVARRAQIVHQRTRVKNEIHAVLAAHLIPKCPAADLFGKKGRAWLAQQPLPLDERLGVAQRLRELDRLGEDLAAIDRQLGQSVLEDARVHQLLTITGVNATVAIGLLAAIGDVARFRSAEKLVSYFGLNPSVYQSGLQPAKHGHISKRGRSHARAMLVEAAWAAAKSPGPLRAFFLRIRQRRGMQIAAVATARKLAVIAWHVLTSTQDYAWTRPALTATKRRALELQAGWPAKRGQKGEAAAYRLKHVRDRERALAEQAERSYARFVARWRAQPRANSTGAANPTRTP
jgi:transposase